MLGYFRAFLTWLHRMDRIERVPAFPRIPRRDYRPTIISKRTQRLILEQIPNEQRGAFLAAAHGIRPGELRALDVGDYQERESVPGLVISKAVKGPNAKAPIGSTKTGDSSWIPIDEELAEWIEWRLDQRVQAGRSPTAGPRTSSAPPWISPALFVNPAALTGPNPQWRWTANKLREVWNTAAQAVGVKVKMYEGTKHSSATAWRTQGMTLEMVRRMLRHRDARSTELYGKLADEALVEAFRRTKKKA